MEALARLDDLIKFVNSDDLFNDSFMKPRDGKCLIRVA